MCVLTYVPLPDEGVVITHNRDEHVNRPKAHPPAERLIAGEKVIFPTDPQGGGTWFAIHDEWICCLLNGAFEKHNTQPPYKASRGTIIPLFFEFLAVDVFLQSFDPHGFEPFTLVLFNAKNVRLQTVVWDGETLHHPELDASKPHIWSSSTLYDHSVKTERENQLGQYLTKRANPDRLLSLHQIHSPGDPARGYCVNLNDQIHTVAIMQVYGAFGDLRWRYEERF